MKKIFSFTLVVLLLSLVLSAAIPKAGPMVVITLVNKMLTQQANISLNGLTAFHTYYLTARAWPVDVKFPASLSGYTVGKHQDTTFEIRADYYETIVTACGESRSGVMDLTHRTKYVFPLCDKKNVMNQGEPRMEKISTVMSFPGVYNQPDYCEWAGLSPDDCTNGGLFDAEVAWCMSWGNTVGDCKNWVASYTNWNGMGSWWDFLGNNVTVGDGYSVGDAQGLFKRSIGGNQVRWSLDFYNWQNNGTDVWH